MIASAVYILCTLTSLACAGLLLRGYGRSKTRLLLWSGLCFAFLAVNNALLFTDKVLFPGVEHVYAGISFAVVRSATAVVGLGLLLYGLIWDAE